MYIKCMRCVAQPITDRGEPVVGFPSLSSIDQPLFGRFIGWSFHSHFLAVDDEHALRGLSHAATSDVVDDTVDLCVGIHVVNGIIDVGSFLYAEGGTIVGLAGSRLPELERTT